MHIVNQINIFKYLKIKSFYVLIYVKNSNIFLKKEFV